MTEISPLVIQEIEALAKTLQARFTPPDYYPGCEVLSIDDIDQYDTNNGWVEARVAHHNRQRIRYFGNPPGVQVGDFLNVVFFPNTKLFQVFGISGTGSTAAPIDSHQVSKLRQSDGGGDALSADATGHLTPGGDYLGPVGVTVQAGWFDFPLMDTGNDSGVASHFKDNDSSYPDGWTETDAPAATNTNANYSFWKILGTSSNTAWDYRRQTSINLESQSANAWTTFLAGPILLKDGRYSADVSYHFGIYRNNAGAIDTATYSRLRVYWNSGSSAWQLVAEEQDGSTPHSTTITLDQTPMQPLYLAFTVQNAAAKTTRQLWGSEPIIGAMRTNIQAPTSAPTWGQMWVRFHQSRGAGITDAISLGALDYLGNTIE